MKYWSSRQRISLPQKIRASVGGLCVQNDSKKEVRKDGTKMAPRWPRDGPEMAPRWPQDGPKIAPTRPKTSEALRAGVPSGGRRDSRSVGLNNKNKNKNKKKKKKKKN